MKVGFIGLGNMGSAIARNLIKAGHTLSVYNRTRSRAEAFGSLGASVAETPAEAASHAEALITMLADDAAVEDVIFSPGNAIRGPSCRCCSYIHEHDQRWVVAPVGRKSSRKTAELSGRAGVRSA